MRTQRHVTKHIGVSSNKMVITGAVSKAGPNRSEDNAGDDDKPSYQ